MKKLWIIGIIAAFVGGAQLAQAGCGHCGKGGAAAGKAGCSKMLEGITLSDEQKAKLAEIEKACDGSKESCEKASASIRAALTAEQQKAFDANAAKPAGKCCDKEKGAA